MDAIGITPKSGIWRASWRATLADAIISCREGEADEAARQLVKLGLETLALDLQRVRDEVLERLGPHHQAADSQLRRAVMNSVLSGMTEQVHNVLQLETRELVPAA